VHNQSPRRATAYWATTVLEREMKQSNWTTLDLGNYAWGVTMGPRMSGETSPNLPHFDSWATAHDASTGPVPYN